MRKLFLLILVSLLSFSLSGVYAQGAHGKGCSPKMLKEIKEFKLKFLAQEMELTEAQQKPFFDLYNSMMEAKHKVFSHARRLERRLKKNPSATEADYKAAADAMSEAKRRDAEIECEYDAKFAEILSQKQLYKMKEAEDTFRKKMRDIHGRKVRRSSKAKGKN